MKQFLILLIYLSGSANSYAQEIDKHYIDSVVVSAVKINDVSKKKDVIDQLCTKIIRLKPETSLSHFQYIDSTYSNYDDILVFTYLYAAPCLVNNGEIEASKKMRHRGLRLAKTLGFPDSQYDFFQSLSSFYVNTAVVDSATYYANEAEKIVQENPERLGQLLWQVYHRKGDIQYVLGDFEKQGYWFEKAWEELAKYPNHPSRGFFLYIITDYYHEIKDHVQQAKYAELLIAYYKQKELKTPDYHFPVESVLLNEFNPDNIAHLKRVIEASDSLNNYNAYSTSAYILAKALMENGASAEAIPISMDPIFGKIH